MHRLKFPVDLVLLLHLIGKVIPRDLEFLLYNVAHGHQILKSLLQDRIHAYAV